MNFMHSTRRFQILNKNLKNASKIIAVLVVILTTTSHINAQQVYKSVDKQGRITYSQVPPLTGSGDKLTGESAENPRLPYTLQQVVDRYPVMLYVTPDCSGCIAAKLMLTQRGVPFTEKMVSSREDFEAFKQISKDNSLPLATIATQQLIGYQEDAWTRYLDAAGYPKTSALPRQYKNPEQTPLATKKTPAKTEKIETIEKPAVNTAPAPIQQPSNNPAGIRF